MISKRQKQTLEYIKKFIAKHGYAPSLEEIKKHLRLSSVSTAHYHVELLKQKGLLSKETNQPRAVDILSDQTLLEIPILGTIAAGHPIEVIETRDKTITIAEDGLSPNKLYALQVQGNSMIEDGIFDKDIVIIREQKVAENGQTVVAIIDDNQATLKRIYKEKNRIRLQPANPELFPIYRDEVEVRGVVVKIIRNVETPVERKGNKKVELKRRIDYTWDYKNEKTKTNTHGMHTYPAMFIPQVAKRLIETYSKNGDTICDIFCGSGTALIEGRLLCRNSYGIDLNPFAIFLAKVKTTPIDPTILNKEYFRLLSRIDEIKDKGIENPDFFNIDFWFKPDVIVRLSKIKQAIKKIKAESLRNFFLISFSETVRLVSNTRNGEFKLFRIPQEKLNNYNPDVLETFKKKTETNMMSMKSFFKSIDQNAKATIIYGNSATNKEIPKESIDLILTSPPYGDSRTTVAYGQFSRLSAQWIDIFDDPNKASEIDRNLLGGRPSVDLKNDLKSEHLEEVMEKISSQSEKRAKDVLSFYIELDQCLRRAYDILKPNKYLCVVVGNRLVKQVRIPTDFIIAELCMNIGFVCEDIFVRNIPGKRMPLKNSPTNVAGQLEETMSKESIVVLKKS